MISRFIFIFIALCVHGFTNAQVSEGTVLYDITYPENRYDSAVIAVLPVECQAYFNKEMVRLDMASGAGINNRIIVNNKNEEVHVLTEIYGSKTDFFMSGRDRAKMSDEEFKVTYTEEKKNIAGYPCSKAEVKSDKGQDYSVWFTSEITAVNSGLYNQFRGIDGFLLEFEVESGAVKMKMTAREVKPGKVEPEIFLIPEGYQRVTEQDLKRMEKGK
jgi:GLPGLI family protein